MRTMTGRQAFLDILQAAGVTKTWALAGGSLSVVTLEEKTLSRALATLYM